MLCDLMLEEWADPAISAPTVSDEERQISALAQTGASREELRAAVDSYGRDRWNQLMKRLDEYDRQANKTHLLNGSISFEKLEVFKEKVAAAQKFFLTSEFASASLDKMATTETVIKSQEWFRLIHDPMWMEWQIIGAGDLRMAALLYSEPVPGGDPAIMCYVVAGVKRGDRKGFNIRLVRILPDTIRLAEKGYELDVEDEHGRILADEETHGSISLMAYDFVIRLNSPRITDFRPCDDMTKLNKKRAKLGRMPLCTYQIVDLNNEIKRGLRMTDQEGEGGVRFHWRRGHFKACRTGIFWWNPHTAGRKVFGEIKKDYAA